METIYDFVTVAIFLGIIGIFLHFSRREDQKIAPYMIPMLFCAIANQLGNQGMALYAWLLIGATFVYCYTFLVRPQGIADER